MPNKIKPRRSYTANSVPLVADLEENEMAVNWTDGKIFVRRNNAIITLTLGGSGGSASSEDTALRALFVPPAPAGVSAIVGNAQAIVSWTAPTVLSVTPITDYVVQYSSNSGSTWTTFSDGTATATTATVTGLTNGTAYTFRVAAVNGVGTGTYSTASSAVTPSAGTPPGALYGWGYDGYGQLGDGSATDAGQNIAQVGSSNWKSVSAGFYHSIAIRSDNTLWGWGNGGSGQLGLAGVPSVQATPAQIGSSEWSAVSAGTFHAIAIRSDGTLWGWGNVGGSGGPIGDGSYAQRNAPVQIGSATDWASVSAGYSHSFAIKSDGTLWGWGAEYSRFGDGTINASATPVQIGTSTWLSASAGEMASLAIRSDGTLWAWGFGGYNLGTGDSTTQLSPVQIGTSTWLSATRSQNHAIAIRSDGTLWGWGANTYGQVGDGSTTQQSSPVQVGSSTSWLRVGRLSTGATHSLAVRTDGTLWAWGRSNFLQLGTGSTSSESAPVQIGSSTWQAVACGSNYTLGIRA